ncbi:hypothetical protein BS47DRAFT_1366090 [Hydnum rufescens UP504]|uniref:Uncharacterized protein n=1 Tax=Hydnum rufescens UP504 TaxID=1448309 RepID=A0A9P6DRB9_9AGAM|nr:hypothetical protein BS47DRAFT_1366090 [Hydnum rufescens UP504]
MVNPQFHGIPIDRHLIHDGDSGVMPGKVRPRRPQDRALDDGDDSEGHDKQRDNPLQQTGRHGWLCESFENFQDGATTARNKMVDGISNVLLHKSREDSIGINSLILKPCLQWQKGRSCRLGEGNASHPSGARMVYLRTSRERFTPMSWLAGLTQPESAKCGVCGAMTVLSDGNSTGRGLDSEDSTQSWSDSQPIQISGAFGNA